MTKYLDIYSDLIKLAAQMAKGEGVPDWSERVFSTGTPSYERRDMLSALRMADEAGITHALQLRAIADRLSAEIRSSNEPGAVTRLPAPGTTMTRLSDIADELIRQLRKQGMEKMQAVFDGMRLRIDPWPEQPVATPGATPPGEDSVWQSAESSRPRELLAQQMEPDTSPLTHQEIFSAVHHHAAEIVKLTAAVPAQCTLGASRDASPADLVGALQDVVHTDPGPVRAGKSVRSGSTTLIPCVYREGCRKFPACMIEARCCGHDAAIPSTR